MATVQVETAEKHILGQPIKRVEDQKFIEGVARYVDDIRLPNMLYAAFVRSPHAHAKITKIDASKARERAGVVLVLTGSDLAGKVSDMPTVSDEAEKRSTRRPVLATEQVNYAGEAVAVVLSTDQYAAEDAVELVEVEYDPLEAVEEPERAMAPTSPKVHEYLPNNVAYHTTYEKGELERAFRDADQTIRLELVNQRVAPVSLEPRGVVASYDSGSGTLTVWLSTQDPHGSRSAIAERLRLPDTKVRVVAPDVGGAFGAKISVYPEDLAVSYASKRLNRPVKWMESRRENLLCMTHGRGQKQYVEAAVKNDGRLLGLKIRIVADIGAYSTGGALDNPSLTLAMAPGLYDLGAYRAEVFCVLTNKVPQDAYRGAGRPEASYLIERTMGVVARRLKLDPVKIRMANFVKRDAFPYTTISGMTYDTGDYEMNLRKALQVSDYEELKAQQREARARGRLLGIGLVTWIEVCGFAPGYPQTAIVNVTANGNVMVTIGGHPHGQGHVTSMAQIVAEELGVDLDRITVNHGDTGSLPWGTMTAGSRSAALTGSAVLMSARKVKKKMSAIAGKMLGAEAETMLFREGTVYSAALPEKTVSFSDLAEAAYTPSKLPDGMEATLFEYSVFNPSNNLYPFGTHIALVEVDPETGVVKMLKYFATDDVGRVLNPLVAEGQVHGGVVQGIGQAMLEEVVYDENGQNLTSTLADYTISSAESIPWIEWNRTETLTDVNPLGVKGIGEAGTIASTTTIVDAVEDALASYGVTISRMPLRPESVRNLIGETRPSG